MRLLIVEDNEQLALLMTQLLTQQGFVVDAVATVDAGEAALRATDYNLVILDLSLPDGDGSEILQRLWNLGGGTPVIVATASDDVMLRVRTLNKGADDYLVKPFLFEELLARIRVVLRRPRQIAQDILPLSNLELNIISMETRVNGEPIRLSRRELAVLTSLMRRPGHLVSKQNLEKAMYSFDNDVTPNAIEAAVSRLRRTLESAGADVAITAMRGLGYIISDRPAC